MDGRRIAFVLAALALAALALPAAVSALPAEPFETNAECRECHDAAFRPVDFEAPAVDKSRCNACHWKTGHYNHGADRQCNSCHYTMPNRTEWYYPTVSTPYGYFSSANSPDLPAEVLHDIHVNGSWPKTVLVNPYTYQPDVNCVSCHQPAACDACHGGDVPHGDHPAAGYAPVTYTVARGVSSGSGVLDTTSSDSVYCVNDACHSLSVADAGSSRAIVQQNSSGFFTYGGRWFTGSSSYASGGTYTYTAAAASTASFTFYGPGVVELYGRRDPAAGIASVSVDGGPPVSVDMYAGATFWNALLFRTDPLGDGTHSVVVTVTGTRQPASTGNTIVIDRAEILTVSGSAAGFVPACASCHGDKTVTHGYENVDHVADVGADTHAGKACASCHSMNVYPEHERASSASAGGGCGTCHPSPRDSFAAWGQTCQEGGCHPAASAYEPHAGQAADHALPEAPAAVICRDCHAGTDLALVHAAAAASDDPARTSCNVCHTPSAFPPTNDCTVCHFTFDGHYDTAKHTSTWTLEGCIASGCHTSRDLMTEHGAMRPGFTCQDCHDNVTKPEYDAAIAAGDTACGACHTGITSGGGHYAVHSVSPPLLEADGTGNYTYGVGSTGTLPTSDCAMCHGENLVDEHLGGGGSPPKKAFDGSFLTCASCHDSTDPAVGAAIAGTGLTACENCHQVHGQIPLVHTSTFTGSAEDDCALCHSSDLTVVHDYEMTATLPSGRMLTGCELCHDYREGELGPIVQTAIDVTNDTRCTACHSAYHGGALASHTAIPAPSVQDCERCHNDGSVSDGTDVTVVHAAAPAGGCAVCHSNPARVGDITLKTAECASCHATSGTDYHREMAVSHTYGSMDASCLAAGCHVSNGLPQEHERFLGRYASYADTCELCHLNADPARIDWGTASANCSTCHIVHGDIAVIHSPTGSQACVDCHETADVRTIHATVPGDQSTSCAVCHNATTVIPATADCAGCHGALSPPDPAHYTGTETSHTAGDGVLNPGGACSGCHYLEMKPEHSKASSGPVPCVACHETNVDALTTAWDKSCSACHATKHGSQASKHASPRTDCAGSGCHDVTDVAVVHAALPGNGCPACHVGPGSVPSTTDCTTICHTSFHAEKTSKHTAVTTASVTDCGRCHSDGDAVTGVSVEPLHSGVSSDACTVCHANPTRVPDVNAVTAECASCHATSGTDYHRSMEASHTWDAMSSEGCLGSACHDSNALPEAHAPYVGTVTAPYPQYADSCELCHLNEDPARIDWSTASADCRTCHYPLHAEAPSKHLAPESQECVDCHETADVYTLHASRPEGECAVCHNATVVIPESAACVGCHEYSPMDSLHYDPAAHLASEEAACGGCHYPDMKAEHFKTSSGPVSCVQCHEIKVDAFTTEWDKKCAACHPTKHGEQNTKHVSSNTACSGSGCHSGSDVSVLHSGAAASSYGFTDGFESGFGGWSTRTNWNQTSSYTHSGSYAARQSSSSLCTLVRSFNTKTGASIDLRFWLLGTNATESSDWIKVEFQSASGTWRTVWSKTLQDRSTSWQQIALTLDEATYGPFGSGTQLRITADVSDSSEYQTIDDLALTQPDDTTSATGCSYCHKSPSQPATTTDCMASGCHEAANPHHGMISLKLTSNSSSWESACDDCHGRVHDRGSCDRCHEPSRLHGESSRHVDSNSDCLSCHNVATADRTKNCLACHKDLGSSGDGGDDGGGSWGGGGW